MTPNALWLKVYEKHLCAVLVWGHRALLLWPCCGGFHDASSGSLRRSWLRSKTKSLITADRAIKNKTVEVGHA